MTNSFQTIFRAERQFYLKHMRDTGKRFIVLSRFPYNGRFVCVTFYIDGSCRLSTHSTTSEAIPHSQTHRSVLKAAGEARRNGAKKEARQVLDVARDLRLRTIAYYAAAR